VKHEHIVSTDSNYHNKYSHMNCLKVGHSKYVSVNHESSRNSKEKIDETEECKIKALHVKGHVKNG
jgi:hypothetical protein